MSRPFRSGKQQTSQFLKQASLSNGPISEIRTYQITQPITSPAYTMGKKYDIHQNFETPGPGAYDPKKQFKQSPRAVIVGSKDSFYQINPIPGPGQYQEKFYKTQGYSFSRERKHRKTDQSSPGPAAYKAQQYFSSPKAVIPRAIFKHKLDYSIGPGSYNIASMLQTDKGFRIPLSRRRYRRENPGPGPAAYSPTSKTFRKGFKFSKSPKSSPTERLPGPGDYSPKILSENSPRVIIGKAARESKSNTKFPGPGDYDIPIKKGPEYSFPKYEWSKQIDVTPVTYIQEYSSLRRTAGVITRARQREKVLQTPGPGTYKMEGFFGKP